MPKLLNLDVKDEFKDAFEVVKLNVAKMQEISQRIDATKPALLFIILSSLATTLGLVIFSPALIKTAVSSFGDLTALLIVFGWILAIILPIVELIFYIWLLSFVAEKMFNGRAYFDQFFRVMGYGSVIRLINIVPDLSVVSSVWYLVITWYVLRRLSRLPVLDSLLTILLVIAATMVLLKLLGGPVMF